MAAAGEHARRPAQSPAHLAGSAARAPQLQHAAAAPAVTPVDAHRDARVAAACRQHLARARGGVRQRQRDRQQLALPCVQAHAALHRGRARHRGQLQHAHERPVSGVGKRHTQPLRRRGVSQRASGHVRQAQRERGARGLAGRERKAPAGVKRARLVRRAARFLLPRCCCGPRLRCQ